MTIGAKDLRFAVKGMKIKSKEKENIDRNVLTTDLWVGALSRAKLKDPACCKPLRFSLTLEFDRCQVKFDGFWRLFFVS